jgi:hypothetical protein
MLAAFLLLGVMSISANTLISQEVTTNNLNVGVDSITQATLNRPLVSTKDVYLEVKADGTKNYTTIQAAINKVPYFLLHNYTIKVHDGYYNENLVIPSITLGDSIHPTEGAVAGLKLQGNLNNKNAVIVNSLSIVGSTGSSTPMVRYMTFNGTEPRSDENVTISIYHSNQVDLSYLNITGNSLYAVMLYSSNLYATNNTFNGQQYGYLLKRNSKGTFGDVGGYADEGVLSSGYIFVNSGYAEIVNEAVTVPSDYNCGNKGGFVIDGRTNSLYCLDNILTSGVQIDRNNNEESLNIDSEATTAGVVTIESENVDGNTMLVRNNGNHADSSNAVFMSIQEHASSTGMLMYLRNDGTGPTLRLTGGVCQSGNGAYFYESGGELYACDNGGNSALLT